MSRALRGLWSRRGSLAALVAMTAVVVTGAVAVMGFAGAAGTSRALTAPLLLLGAVAVPAIGRELASARRDEVGLARLRGARGARLAVVVVAEPLLAVVVGSGAGVALGSLVARVAARRWAEAPAALDATTFLAAAGIALGGLLVVVVAGAAALREPLAVQVAGPERPRRAGVVTSFLGVLVLVGAAVAAYRSGLRTTGSTGTPDLLVLLGPALLGLAVAQLTVWLVRGLARAAASRTDGGLAGYLAARRVARADDLVGPLRLLVAAAVVGVLATTGARAVDDWAEAQARLTTFGATTVPYDGGAVGALALTRALDPEGEHLMAAALVPGGAVQPGADLAERRAYVDSARFGRVVGAGLAGTPAEETGRAIEVLAPPVPDWLTTGDRARVTLRALEPRADAVVEVRIGYVGAESSGTTQTFVDLAPDGSPVQVDVPLRDCADGCVPTGITVSRAIRLSPGEVVNAVGYFDPFNRGQDPIAPTPVELTEVEVGGADLLDATWQPVEAPARAVRQDDAGLELRPPADDLLSVVPVPADAVPILLTTAGDAAELTGAWAGVGADPVPARSAASLAALPLVGRVGALGDLPTAVFGAANTTPATSVMVVVGAGTPPALVRELTDATGSRPRALDDVRREVVVDAGADQAVGYGLMAVFCVAVALLAMAAGVARHQASYRRDVASLRAAGIGLPLARRAGRAELVVLAVVVCLASGIGGSLAVGLLLGGLPLVRIGPGALPLDTSPSVLAALAWAFGAAVTVLVVGSRARAARAGGTRPALLREGER